MRAHTPRAIAKQDRFPVEAPPATTQAPGCALPYYDAACRVIAEARAVCCARTAAFVDEGGAS
jgi:hypothetical protein